MKIMLKQPKRAKINYRFFNFFCKFFAIYILIVLVLLNTINLFWGHLFRTDLNNYSVIFLIFALIIPFVCFLLLRVLAKSKDKHKAKDEEKTFRNFLIIGTLVLFALQMLVFVGMFFVSGWEVHPTAFVRDNDSEYFSVYPNNLFLRSLFFSVTQILNVTGLGQFLLDLLYKFIPQAANVVQIHFGSLELGPISFVGYIFIVFLNIATTMLVVVMISKIAKVKISTKWGVIAFIFSAIFVGLMPWILVPYTDTIALFFTTVIFYVYVLWKNKYAKVGVIIFCSIVGFNIKPTVIFALFAIAVVEIYLLFKKYKLKKNSLRANFKHYVKYFGVAILTTVISLSLVVGMKNSTGIEIDTSKEYGALHFLMMGTNPEYEGIFNLEDVDISASAANKQERNEKNIEKIKENLQVLGPAGLFQLVYKKTMCNYEDGTFHWGREGNFNIADLGFLQPIKDFYNNYAPLAQVLWFIVLLGCIFILFKNNFDKHICFVCLSLLFLSGFLTVFECGSRYLILYLGYFIFISALGWSSVFVKVNNKFNRLA